MKKLLVFMGIFALILPLMFLGCSDGDDGSTGAAGAPGAPGDPGPGAMANETCVLCHGDGKIVNVADAHDTATGLVTATITDASFNPADNTASVTFTFQATTLAKETVPDNVLLTPSGSNLAYARFTIARLIPAAAAGDPDSWFFYGPRSHRTPADLVSNGGGSYTFTFRDDVALDPAEAGFTHRVGIEIYPSGFDSSLRSVNPTFDFVPSQGAGPYTFAQTREIVTTAACNACHNPLGYTPSFHGSRRVEIKHCQLCHNPNNALAQDAGGADVPIPFVKLIHGIHTGQALDIYEDGNYVGDFTEVTYPQDPRNCTTCHQGGADSDNWNTRPTIEACGACHGVEIFEPGGGHAGGAQTNNAGCAGCHPATAIPGYHATENITPNNPLLPGTLSYFEYGIDSVTVDNTNAATIKFFIKQDNVLADLGDNTITRPTGFTGGPSFLFAYAMEQDGVSSPVDYNNLGRTAGQPESVSIIGLPIVASDNASYTVTVADAFPAGAKMRAVALQGYFTQTSGGTGLDNVGRHTPSVIKAVTGDTVRRTIVKSGYVGGQPEGCLECHEIFEGHGGNRVNNVQVCVTCHNPNLSSSGRTVEPADADPDVVAELGPDPLVWPEATNNMKEMIHGIHAATDRPYEFVRNSAPRVVGGSYYNWSEVTFPGNLANCEKCHVAGTYEADLPANILWTTEVTTEGAGTLDDILAARGSVPNLTDLVNSPVTSACYYCHDSGEEQSHFILQGGKLSITREDALALP